MNLFIENPQPREHVAVARQREADESQHQPKTSQAGGMPAWHEEAVRVACAGNAQASASGIARDAYRAEEAYAQKRAHRRRRGHVVRMIATAILFPVLLVAVFFAAYALTCIANGASPQQLVYLMGQLVEHIAAFAAQAAELVGGVM